MLLTSMSVDDIGIRKQLELIKNGRIVGYQDVGTEVSGVDFGGGPATTPAIHVMVIMLTALNERFQGYWQYNRQGNFPVCV